MSDESPYDIKTDYNKKHDKIVQVGGILEFRAGRHIAIHRFNTNILGLDAIIYHLDDFAIDPGTNKVIPELRAPDDVVSRHMTGGHMTPMSQFYSYPTQYTAKNKSERIYWRLSVPIRMQSKVIDNGSEEKFIQLYIPRQDKSKFSVIREIKEIDFLRENSNYINIFDVYEKNRICGKWHRILGCSIL